MQLYNNDKGQNPQNLTTSIYFLLPPSSLTPLTTIQITNWPSSTKKLAIPDLRQELWSQGLGSHKNTTPDFSKSMTAIPSST